jgi:dihydroxyacetone kinase
VGPGFADGAVVGNIFPSPSAAEAASVGRAANGGGGVLLTTGNYAGDFTETGGCGRRCAGGVRRIDQARRGCTGDKTMLDALLPFVETLEAGVADGRPWLSAWVEAADVARQAAERTADLRPKVGRARPLAERSVGAPDAGAISLAMCVRVVADVFELKRRSNDEAATHRGGP